MALDLWGLVARWWEIDIPVLSSIGDWDNWMDGCHLKKKTNECLDVVWLTVFWVVWNFRNKIIFDVVKPRKAMLWDLIQSQSFLWVNARCSKVKSVLG